MNQTDGIANVKYLPPCYCSHGGMGRDLVTGQYVWHDPTKKPKDKRVFVVVGGRRREVKRWKWMWRIVAWMQEVVA